MILDNLATLLARRNGYTGKSSVYFPISASAAAFEDDGRRKMRQLAPDDREIIAGLQPFDGGNRNLFRLHKLDVERKHYDLVVQAAVVGEIRLKIPSITTGEMTNWLFNENSTFVLHQMVCRSGGVALVMENPPQLTDKYQDFLWCSHPMVSFQSVRASVCFPKYLFGDTAPVMEQLREFHSEVNKVVALF